MDGNLSSTSPGTLSRMTAPAGRILDVQRPDGAIPWFEDGPWDPWNHTECAMALTAMGEYGAATTAFDHLLETQRDDGAWLGEYGNALPMVDRDYISREKAPSVLDTNFCAYPAVGVLHYLMATGDLDQVGVWWPMVKASLDFVIGLQRADGTIPWSFEAIGTDEEDALLPGNASIAKSLECGIRLGHELGKPITAWTNARRRLVEALRHHPHAFDRRGTGSRFAMDWYYPILSGALEPKTAQDRLKSQWDTFVAEQGCRCVSDEPWITVAETCELVLALITLDQRKSAARVFETIFQHRDPSGVFWMGWQTEEQIFWPKEQPSWTQAAAILAADALQADSLASQLLTHAQLETSQNP